MAIRVLDEDVIEVTLKELLIKPGAHGEANGAAVSSKVDMLLGRVITPTTRRIVIVLVGMPHTDLSFAMAMCRVLEKAVLYRPINVALTRVPDCRAEWEGAARIQKLSFMWIDCHALCMDNPQCLRSTCPCDCAECTTEKLLASIGL